MQLTDKNEVQSDASDIEITVYLGMTLRKNLLHRFGKYNRKHVFSPFFRCRFIIYKLPRYQIGQVGSGVDYMYLDSSVGSWQLSKFMVNTSQGAIGSTLNQLYKGKVYMVRSCPHSLSGVYPLIAVYRNI